MRIRQELQKRIERKQEEIRSLELQLAQAKAYLQALEDSLRLLPKEPMAQKLTAEQVLRPGSAVAKAREAILKVNKPLHVNEILKAIGRPTDKNSRVSLSGSLSSYAKRGQIFTRPAPNTFGLVELNHSEMPEDELPENFGSLPPDEAKAPPTTEDDDVPF